MYTCLNLCVLQVLSESSRSVGTVSELQGLAAQVKAALADAHDLHFKPTFLLQGFDADGVQANLEHDELMTIDLQPVVAP